MKLLQVLVDVVFSKNSTRLTTSKADILMFVL